MQEFAKFISLQKTSGSSSVIQGVKGGRTPRNAIRGGNGSFRVYDRGEVRLTLEYNGNRYSKDIYLDIKEATGGKNITDKLCSKLESAFENFNFTVEDGKFTNIYEAIESAL